MDATRRWAWPFPKRRVEDGVCCCQGPDGTTPPSDTITTPCCGDTMPRTFVARLLITGGITSPGCVGDIGARSLWIWTPGGGLGSFVGLDAYVCHFGTVCDLDYIATVVCDPSQAADPVTRGWFVDDYWGGLTVPGGGAWITRPCDDPDGFERDSFQSSGALPRQGATLFLTAGDPA